MDVPILQKDFSYPDMGLKFFKKLPVMFIAGNGAKVQMHFDIDYADIFLCHFGGKKKVMLFSPSQTPLMYHVPYSFSSLHDVDFINPDYEKYPALKGLKGVEVELNHGDVLYIPPGCPHEGYAVENALNYSVGFRAPNQRDLLSQFADHLIDTELGNTRYGDSKLTLRDSKGELNNLEAEQIKQLMIAAIDDNTVFKTWLGNSLSQPKHDMDLAPLVILISMF